MFANARINHRVSVATSYWPQVCDGLFLTVISKAIWSPIIPPLLNSPSLTVPSTFKTTPQNNWWIIAGNTSMARWRMESHTACKVEMSPNHSSFWLDANFMLYLTGNACDTSRFETFACFLLCFWNRGVVRYCLEWQGRDCCRESVIMDSCNCPWHFGQLGPICSSSSPATG